MLCDICIELGMNNCLNCTLGNPCLGCEDYEEETATCKSGGGCADMRGGQDEQTKKL